MREILVMTSRTSARTDCRGGGGEAEEPLGTGVFGQFSLEGKSCGIVAFGNPKFFWREIILVMSNVIKSRKEHKRRGVEI